MGVTTIRTGLVAGICGALLAACAPTGGVQMTPQQQTEFADEMVRTDPGVSGDIPPADRFGAY